MSRFLLLAYGLSVYALFLVTFVYLIGFVVDVGVPRSIDAGGPRRGAAVAAAVDAGLLVGFGLIHSVMIRPGLRRVWASRLPCAAERSAFVMVTCACLAAVFWLWHPLPWTVWRVGGLPSIALETLALLGWVVVLVSTFLLDHFELFGVRQVWAHWRRRPCRPPELRDSMLYGIVRHPLTMGFLVAFWATPRMTVGHLLFASTMTLYALVAIRLEERDLLRLLGRRYAAYRRRVPMLLPALRRGR